MPYKDPAKARAARMKYNRKKMAENPRYYAEQAARHRANDVERSRRLARERYYDAPEKSKARGAVQYALKTGKLVKGRCCVCGTDENIEGHHDDYSKPLEVRWLCKAHHEDWHVWWGTE